MITVLCRKGPRRWNTPSAICFTEERIGHLFELDGHCGCLPGQKEAIHFKHRAEHTYKGTEAKDYREQ